MARLTAVQHLQRALTDLVQARNAEPDGGYKDDIQVLIDDTITEIRARRGVPQLTAADVEPCEACGVVHQVDAVHAKR
jgi:hypothetical protein